MVVFSDDKLVVSRLCWYSRILERHLFKVSSVCVVVFSNDCFDVSSVYVVVFSNNSVEVSSVCGGMRRQQV